MKQVVDKKNGYRSVYENQCFASGLIYSGSGFRVLMTKKLIKEATEKPSSTHAAHQNMTFFNFFFSCGSFLPSWIRIRNTVKNDRRLLAGEINVSINLTNCCGEKEEIPSSSTSGSLMPTPCPFSTS